MIARTACIAAALLVAQTLTPPRKVDPAAAVERTGPGLVTGAMVHADAQSFASALAQAGHAAGFIMPMTERQGMVPPDRGEKLTLDEAIEIFSARTPYRVVRQRSLLVFQHAKTPADILAALDVPVARTRVETTVSKALFQHVLRGLARVRVGGTIGAEPGAGPDCPVEQTITINAGATSSINTLNAIAQQVKGLNWMVRFGTGTTGRLQVGYICGNGVWSALSVPGW